MYNKYSNPNDNWYSGRKQPEYRDGYWKTLLWYLIVILVLFIAQFFTSCESIQYVPVETVRTDYVHTTDTVRQIDSIFSERETIVKEADSALVRKLGLQLKSNEKAILILRNELQRQISSNSKHRTDTVIKTDSVQVPYPVERQLSRWEKIKLETGGLALGACILLIIMLILGLLIRARK